MSTRGMIAVLLALAGCTAGAEAKGPRDIALGVDACEYCHMALDDVNRAAQWVPVSGPAVVFDEAGCLIAWLQRNPGAAGRPYVADEGGSGWIAAEEAAYVLGGSRTGMGFDVIAFASSEPAASRVKAVGGEVVSWTTLRERGVRDAHEH